MSAKVYVAYTSYHVFVSLLMAFSDSERRYDLHLVIVSNFADADLLSQALSKYKAIPFKSITLIQGEYNCKEKKFPISFINRYLGVRKICLILKDFIKKGDFSHIYLFNEERPYSLAIMDYINKIDRKMCLSFVEDGLVTYNSYVENKDFHYILLGKIFYGFWWKNIEVMGRSACFNDIFIMFPQFVRPELDCKKIKKIPIENLEKIRKNRIAENILVEYDISVNELVSLHTIILLSHSSVIERFPMYKDVILGVIKKAQETGYKVAIKYHPRDNGATDFLGLRNEPNIIFLRSSAPLELIYLAAKDNIRLVIADLSTAILSASLILDKASVISTSLLLGNIDNRFLIMAESLGIHLPKSYGDFGNYLSLRKI